jgi:hypothetical protein
MLKNYKSKYCNPSDPDISISTQHIVREGFSCAISQENIPINKYSIILKNTNFKRTKDDTTNIME